MPCGECGAQGADTTGADNGDAQILALHDADSPGVVAPVRTPIQRVSILHGNIMNTRTHIAPLWLIALSASVPAAHSAAQDYPTKPVRLLVGSGPRACAGAAAQSAGDAAAPHPVDAADRKQATLTR